MVGTTGVSAGPITTFDFKPSLRIVAAHVDVLGMKLNDFKVPLKRAVEQVVIPSIRTNFAVGGRPGWAPYAESTINFHKLLGEGMSGQLLVKTGALQSVMTSTSVWTITKDEAFISDIPSNVWYGKVQQAGYPGGNNNGPIPARPFVMLQPGEEDKIDDIFDHWLLQCIDEAWPT